MDEWTGTFELVNPRDIIVDHRYQRAERSGLIATIASSPDWAAFAAVSCYKRGSLYYCFDGQQRLRGVLASEKPPRLVPVLVHDAAPLEQEAKSFVTVNVNRKSVDSFEKHRGLLVAKDPMVLAVERGVAKAGFTTGTVSGPRTIAAIASLYYVYFTLGEDGLTQVLVLIRDAWPDNTTAISSNILRGIADTIAGMNGTYNRAKITAAFAKTSPSVILRKAEELRFDIGGSKQANVRRAIKTLAKV